MWLRIKDFRKNQPTGQRRRPLVRGLLRLHLTDKVRFPLDREVKIVLHRSA